MLTEQCITESSKDYVNPIQTSPLRASIYSINRCQDEVIGFEFVKQQYIPRSIRFCNNVAVSLCSPVETVNPIILENAEFWATDDPCYQKWIVKKIELPDIEIQRDVDDKVIGILVRFFNYESCCYPVQMAFRLQGIDSSGCKFILASGLLIFK